VKGKKNLAFERAYSPCERKMIGKTGTAWKKKKKGAFEFWDGNFSHRMEKRSSLTLRGRKK